ncbi:hypothetical protein, partial [Burkholderia contaminans]|uniref:hypothetical protein n=1 Tax=Burkholderia contaminans TaxID=488447 RepID=UPI002D7FC11B
EVRPEYERNSPRMSSNSYVNLKIATCLVRYADDRLIDQRFPKLTARFQTHQVDRPIQKPKQYELNRSIIDNFLESNEME